MEHLPKVVTCSNMYYFCKVKRQLVRPRRRWEVNIKIYLEEVGWEGMDRIDLALVWDGWWALVNAARNLRVSQNAGNLLTGLTLR